jgi:hypothetical protein
MHGMQPVITSTAWEAISRYWVHFSCHNYFLKAVCRDVLLFVSCCSLHMQKNSDAVHHEMLHGHVVQNITDSSVPPVQAMDWFPNPATTLPSLMALTMNWSFQALVRREGGQGMLSVPTDNIL